MSNELLIASTAEHSILVQQFAGGLANRFDAFAEELKKQISYRLLTENADTFEGRKLQALLAEIKQIQQAIHSNYIDEVYEQLELFSGLEGEFQALQLEDVAKDFDAIRPAPAQWWAAVTTNPLVFPDSNVNQSMKSFFKTWSDSEIKRTQNIISTGFVTGETTNSIARRITGKGNHIDKATRRNARTLVRTATNHVSNQARTRTIEENSKVTKGYEWISVLDDRTSAPCRSLDGKVFLTRNKGKEYQPKPPYHPGCRSTIVPVLDNRFDFLDEDATRASQDGPIDAEISYYQFLKGKINTNPDMIDDVLGKRRGELFRRGNISAGDFAKLTVDEKFRPLTIDEINERLTRRGLRTI